jgi:hypothetical protein
MHPSSTFDLGPNGGGASPYHMQYQFPHIPSPIPPSTSTSSTSSGGSSTWRLVLGVAVYPVYIAITLVAMPLPFLYNALYLVFGVLGLSHPRSAFSLARSSTRRSASPGPSSRPSTPSTSLSAELSASGASWA